MLRPSPDAKWLRAAQRVAESSYDPHLKVGALIVSPTRGLLTTGYNAFPFRVKETPERLSDRQSRLDFTVHAEVNAILWSRLPVRSGTMYVSAPPCHECAKAIIQAGVREVIAVPAPPEPTLRHWESSFVVAQTMFKEAGVRYEEMEAEPENDERPAEAGP